MKILWDFRLFSHGYGTRGVGRYTAAVARAILDEYGSRDIVIWGDRDVVPPEVRGAECSWIPYRGGSWKSSIAALPLLALRHHIDIVHYWVALGPVTAIGISPFVPCPTVATVYDAGVERWNTPHGNFIRKTPYWRLQKLFFRRVTGVIAISEATRRDCAAIMPLPENRTVVVYPPPLQGEDCSAVDCRQRKKKLLTLGGSPHKNVQRVVDAFERFRAAHPGYTLIIAGTTDPAERLEHPPEGVEYEPSMERYHEQLPECAALVYCSLNEGLGLPPLEAMSFGTPLLVSSIPPLHETCEGFACFADPLSVESISSGMEAVVEDQEAWSRRSHDGAEVYRRRSAGAARTCVDLYRKLLGRGNGGASC